MIDIVRRRAPMLLAACIALVVVATGMGGADAAAGSAIMQVDSRQVSFAGAIFATETNENVNMVGKLHVVTRLSGSEQTGWAVEWYTNLDNATGTGQVSGKRYLASGAGRGTVQVPPGPPVRSAFFEPWFTLYPPGPPVHPPSPCRLGVQVVFDDNGRVSAVQIHLDQAPIGPID